MFDFIKTLRRGALVAAGVAALAIGVPAVAQAHHHHHHHHHHGWHHHHHHCSWFWDNGWFRICR